MASLGAGGGVLHMGLPMRESGAVLLEVSARPTTRTLSERGRWQRLLQVGLVVGDAAVMAAAAGVAAVNHFAEPVFPVVNDVNVVATSVGPWVLLAWLLANALRGTYAQSHL